VFLAGPPEVAPAVYVVDLVATAAFGAAMNDAGDVTGTSYPDPGCGSYNLARAAFPSFSRAPVASPQHAILPRRTLLPNGRVLVAGGQSSSREALADAEL